MSNILPLNNRSPFEVANGIATRVKARRLQMGWSRKLLASRAGISQWTLKHFEETGQIALETLIKIAVPLDGLDAFAGLFSAQDQIPASMAELEKLHQPARRRGRTRL